MLKSWTLALGVALLLPGLAAAAYQYSPSHYPGRTETLVEGHTVFAAIEKTFCLQHRDDPERRTVRNDCDDRNNSASGRRERTYYNITFQRLGTAVAVLVRDRSKPFVDPPPTACMSNRDVTTTILYENPAVLWFTDQFLVGDDLDLVETSVDANLDVCQSTARIEMDPDALEWRYPCGGWVLATQAGNPDPRLLPWEYTESYYIVDPNDYTWTVDRFQTSRAVVDVPVPGPFSRTVSRNTTVRGIMGTNGASLTDVYWSPLVMWSVPVMGNDVVDAGPGSSSYCEPASDDAAHRGAPNPTYDDGDPSDYDARRYNAVLFFFMEDLVTASRAPKVHGNGARDDTDVTGCHAQGSPSDWPCPAGNDDVEGNSHPYNPVETGSGPTHVHPTAAVDLYFSNVRPPSPDEADREYAVYDTVGSGGRFHEHDGGGFDDRFSNTRCSDTDQTDYTYTYQYDPSTDTMTGPTYTEDHYESSRNGDGENPTDGYDTSDCNSGD